MSYVFTVTIKIPSASPCLQIGNAFYFINSTVVGQGIAPEAASLSAISISSTAGATQTILSNMTFGDNVGGCLQFSTPVVGSPAFTVEVRSSPQHVALY